MNKTLFIILWRLFLNSKINSYIRYFLAALISLVFTSLIFSFEYRVPVVSVDLELLTPQVKSGGIVNIWIKNVVRKEVCQEDTRNFVYEFVRNPDTYNLSDDDFYKLLKNQPNKAAMAYYRIIAERPASISVFQTFFITSIHLPDHLTNGVWFLQSLRIDRCGFWTWLVGPNVSLTKPIKLNVIDSDTTDNSIRPIAFDLLPEDLSTVLPVLKNMVRK